MAGSQATQGLHLLGAVFFSQNRAGDGFGARGPSDKKPQASIHHSLLFPEQIPVVLLHSGLHGHTMVLGISHCVCLGDSWQCLIELLDVRLGMILPDLPLLVSDQVREEAQNGSQLHAALPASGIRSKKSAPASGSVPGPVRHIIQTNCTCSL